MAVEEGGETWVDLFNDGTVLKHIVKEAPVTSSFETPKKGDKVTVHYVGTLADGGTQFDASRTRGKPFEFNVGVGVITGWSEAVPTMRTGEIAKFRICAAKAYGAQGQPPTIPANASLDFEIELLKFTDREDITGDGSIMKKTLKDGNRWQRPNKQCDVKLDVRRCLSGEEEHKEDDEWHSGWWPASKRYDPLVINGATFPAKLRTAVETMKADEVANIRLSSSEKKDDDEEYDVVVHSWVENEECIATKPGAVIKRIEEKAPKGDEDWKTPNDTEEIVVKGAVYRADNAEPLFTFYDGATWDLDEHDGSAVILPEKEQRIPLCDGLEAGLKKMKLGEKAVIKIRHDYAYQRPCETECVMEPPLKVALEARVELTEVHEKKPYWEMDGSEKIAAIDEKRLLGNKHFARGDYERAIRRYDKAIDIGTSTYDLAEETKPKIAELSKAAKLNRAACHLKHRDYALAKTDCTDVLNDDPRNPKALFRRAKALSALDEWRLAKDDLKIILDDDPSNAEAKRALTDIARKEKAHKEKLKRLYAGRRLFSKNDNLQRSRDKVPEADAIPFPQGEAPVVGDNGDDHLDTTLPDEAVPPPPDPVNPDNDSITAPPPVPQ